MALTRAALISICHGGGPLPALNDPTHHELIHVMRKKIPEILGLGTLRSPAAIVIVTAHWEAGQPTISNNTHHKLYYDYGGFPREAYSLKYAARGAPDIAKRVSQLLLENGIESELDATRGWDHGTFIPMLLINPDESIPLVQMSVLRSQSARDHLRIGEALAQLREENVAIIGSGSPSYHNLADWLSGRTAEDGGFMERQRKWTEALDNALTSRKTRAERVAALTGWRDFPHAFEMHPRDRAEHFSPLLVCVGAAQDSEVHCDTCELMGAEQKTYWWD